MNSGGEVAPCERGEKMDKWRALFGTSLGNVTMQKVTENASSVGGDKDSTKLICHLRQYKAL